MKYLWIVFAGAGLLLCILTHLYELVFGQLSFWIYLGLIGISLVLLLVGVILGLVRVFAQKKGPTTQP